MKGRKPRRESRAAEFRQRLMAWNSASVSSRPSLRALARELGTSHQLLAHYLTRLENWQASEHRRLANEISSRANAENLSLTPWEEEQVRSHSAIAFRWTVTGVLNDTLRKLIRKARNGQLLKGEVEMLRIFARKGYSEARAILNKWGSAERSKE